MLINWIGKLFGHNFCFVSLLFSSWTWMKDKKIHSNTMHIYNTNNYVACSRFVAWLNNQTGGITETLNRILSQKFIWFNWWLRRCWTVLNVNISIHPFNATELNFGLDCWPPTFSISIHFISNEISMNGKSFIAYHQYKWHLKHFGNALVGALMSGAVKYSLWFWVFFRSLQVWNIITFLKFHDKFKAIRFKLN